MKLRKNLIALLMIWCLALLPLMDILAQEQFSQEKELWKVVILSDKVGETINFEEQQIYGLFPESEEFISATVFQLPDSSYVIKITEMRALKQQDRIMQINREKLEELRRNIEIQTSISAYMYQKKEQVKILTKKKWDKERWREEILSDQEGTYRGAGGLLGFTLGATVGMLVGKGIQEKKVKRTEDHGGGWDSWTEEFYSYKYKNAPHWGAAIGGISGAVAGYYLGKKADKKYYLLVPKDIRMQSTKTSGFGNFLFGFGVTGPLIGIMTGYTLYTPKSAREGQDFGGAEFFMGYLPGAIMGILIIDAYKRRAKHKELCENSIMRGETDTSYELLPLDPTAFNIYPKISPTGEIYYEYKYDFLRVKF